MLAGAAHIPGLGTFGSGFLSDPAEVVSKLNAAGVQLVSVEGVTGAAPSVAQNISALLAFPRSLGPLGLGAASRLTAALTIDAAACRYHIARGAVGSLANLSQLSSLEGMCSPLAPVPAGWPGAPPECTHLCWAYPLEGVVPSAATAKSAKGWRSLKTHTQLAFLSISTSAELAFVAYGGFALLDGSGRTIGVQSIEGALPHGTSTTALHFGAPRAWHTEYTAQLSKQERFQSVTLPFMLKAGAEKFCWINPGESLVLPSGDETWTPGAHGVFLYLMRGSGTPVFFPRLAAPPPVDISG